MRRAARLGISDSIEWPGFVSEEEKRRLLGNSALLLAPSYEEGWGISVAEALATELPVVGYRLPVLDELFPSAYAAAAPGDIEGSQMQSSDSLSDPAYARTLRRQGSTVIQRYDVSRVAQLELERILSLTRAAGASTRRAT